MLRDDFFWGPRNACFLPCIAPFLGGVPKGAIADWKSEPCFINSYVMPNAPAQCSEPLDWGTWNRDHWFSGDYQFPKPKCGSISISGGPEEREKPQERF